MSFLSMAIMKKCNWLRSDQMPDSISVIIPMSLKKMELVLWEESLSFILEESLSQVRVLGGAGETMLRADVQALVAYKPATEHLFAYVCNVRCGV